MLRTESKYKIKLVYLDTPDYGREKRLFGYFQKLISKWSGLSENITPIVFSKN